STSEAVAPGRLNAHCLTHLEGGLFTSASKPRLTYARYFHSSGHMEQTDVILALAALAQPTRLDVFRALVKNEPQGMPAGDIARELAVPHNTMSSHLNILSRAGLVTSERQSRSIIYRANLGQLQEVVTYLLKDCCGGHPDLCAPLLDALTPCCSPKETANG
ncbi:metalloregulator ArsR/SmtB family transcription factor, partial [Vibrio parahaemolyticus]|nr:metalloregulator ArsR/SmtB family transcription factor [Vibrio parahaemolyticus]